MLERYDAKHLLDEVLNSCCLVLKVLHLVNVTTVHCPIMHIGLFLNLQVRRLAMYVFLNEFSLSMEKLSIVLFASRFRKFSFVYEKLKI